MKEEGIEERAEITETRPLLSEERMPRCEKWGKIIATLNLYLSFFGLGMSVAIPGPTLLSLERLVGTDSEHITFIYISRSSGYLSGSIVGGILLDRYVKQPILIISLLLMGISIAAVPWWTSLTPLIINILINGFAMGCLDTGANICCLDIWNKESGPYLQALHFFFGLGAFVAPLIAEPFLSAHENNNNGRTKGNSSDLLFSVTNNSTSNSTDNPTNLKIRYAYGIIGCYALLIVIFYVTSYCILPKIQSSSKSDNEISIKKRNIPLFIVIISLMTLFMCTNCGVEITFGQLLTAFAVKSDLHLTESVGSYMTSVYWGTYTFARGFSIILVTCSNLMCPLIVDLILITLASICLSVFGNSVVELLWTGVAILGFGLSSVFPSALAWLEYYIPVNSKVASMFIVGVSLGEMILPLAVGHFIDTHPMGLMYATLTCACTMIIFVIIIWRLVTLYAEQSKEEENYADIPHERNGCNSAVN